MATKFQHVKHTPKDRAEAHKIKEKEVEQYLKARVEQMGGMCEKWTGGNGVPDRIVFLNGCVAFVELKRPGGKPRPDQVAMHEKIRRCGTAVINVDRFELADMLIKEMTTKKGHGGW